MDRYRCRYRYRYRPPGYHHNGFLATHALGHMMYDWAHGVRYIDR